jgi:hypothetical protein
MAVQLQLRSGTTTQHSTFIGAVGEVTVDTTKDVLVVHDGITAGGFPNAARANTDGTISLIKKDGTSAGEVNSAGLFNNTLTSTNTNQALTAAQGKALNDQAFGVGQTWQDVTGSRAQSTNYINNTGKTIFVNIYSTIYGNNSSEVTLTVGGLVVGQNITRYEYFFKIAFVCAPVPHGQTYSMSWAGTASIMELR